MSDPKAFDPARHLTLVSGKEYLEVKWRLVWIRSEHPDAIIETELVSHHSNEAVFKAYAKIPNGGSATGWGSEDSQGFGDYLEKAETKAVGRALAALGFGTQFCSDFDFGAAGGRVVDAPVQFRNDNGNFRADGPPPQSRPAGGNAPQRQAGGNTGDLASPSQMGAIYAIGKKLEKLGFTAGDSARFTEDTIGTTDTGTKNDPRITRAQASTLIEALSALQDSMASEVPV
jgi:hypothetical protein